MSTKKIPVLPVVDPNQQWLTFAESARHIRRSAGFVRALLHLGELQASNVGGFLIAREALDRYITSHRKTIPPYRKNSRPWVAKRHAQNRKGNDAE
jgi:hypothetical protein